MRRVVWTASLLVLVACVSKGEFLKKQLEADGYARSLEQERVASKQLAAELQALRGDRDAARRDLAAALAEASGLPQLQAVLAEQFAARAEVLKARSALMAREREIAGLRQERDEALREAEAARVARDEARRDLESAVGRARGAEQVLVAERDKLERQKQLEIAQRQREFEEARARLQEQIEKGDVELRQYKDRVIFGLAERVLFPSGSATISRGGRETLAKVASTIQDMVAKAEAEGRFRLVRVEGHTDDVPIATERFPSNWELSSARATSVVRFLEVNGIASAKLCAVGFGEFWPVASNASAEGRAHNRRIEVVLVPDVERPAIGTHPTATR
jgi:chemotaxis protein MotB